MDTSTEKFYLSVQKTFHDVLKNNQHEFYADMLNLLTSSMKNIDPSHFNSDVYNFWIDEILPLLFNDDHQIQSSAVAAFQLFFTKTDAMAYSFCNNIISLDISEYIVCLQKLQEDKNPYWSQIWSLLIKCLSKEIFKKAHVINLFLSVVELGFRSSNTKMRVESFLCWRSLIETFFKRKELCLPKQIKLICIPLKSSQCKTEETAIIKLRVWWYLIISLGEKFEELYEYVVKPFLIFAFGDQEGNVGVAQQYSNARKIAIPCLTALLLNQPDRCIETHLRNLKLEALKLNSPLLDRVFFEKHWKSIAYPGAVAVRLTLSEDISTESERKVFETILRLLFSSMFEFDFAPYYKTFSKELLEMTPMPSCYERILNAFESDIPQFTRSLINIKNYADILESVLSLLGAASTVLPKHRLQRGIDQFYILDPFYKCNKQYEAFDVICDLICTKKQFEGKYYSAKILIWYRISIVYSNDSNFFLEANACSIDTWVMWPLEQYHYLIDHASHSFDTSFWSLWKTILNSHTKRNSILLRVQESIKKILHLHKNPNFLVEIIDGFASSIQTDDVKEGVLLYRDLFLILRDVLNLNLPIKSFKVILGTINKAIEKLDMHFITALFEETKTTLATVLNVSRLMQIEQYIADWKHEIHKTILSKCGRNIFEHIQALTTNALFTSTLSNLNFNLELLTDRQKEKFSERGVIPALYNDMTLSQDFLKPLNMDRSIEENDIPFDDNNRHSVSSKKQHFLNKERFGKEIGSCSSTNFDGVSSRKSQISAGKKNTEMSSCDEITLLEAQTTARDGTKSLPYCERLLHKTLREFSCSNTEALVSGQNAEIKYLQNNTGVLQMLESPRKCVGKDKVLLSPPDRKTTNVSASPSFHCKTPTNLSGRGAQLINMIRKKHTDIDFPETSKTYKNYKTGSQIDLTDVAQISKQSKDFSSKLTLLHLSPYGSILKRKFDGVNGDDLLTETSVAKRKRVSFHDPPVLNTMEFIENESKFEAAQRCYKNSELKKPENLLCDQNSDPLPSNSKTEGNSTSDKSGSLKCCQRRSISMEDDTPTSDPACIQVNGIYNKNAFLEVLKTRCSVEEVLQAFFCSDSSTQIHLSNTIANFISKKMTSNLKIKNNVLEILSEDHSDDFLSYALQENMPSVICERLNLSSITDYLCSKCKLSSGFRDNVFMQLPILFLNCSDSEKEKTNLLSTLLESLSVNDNTILDIITLLIKHRSERQTEVQKAHPL